MKRVYLAGAYRGITEEIITENINIACRYALKLWSLGFAVLCPHLNTGGFHHFENDKDLKSDIWLKGDLSWLAAADILFVLPNSGNSIGTQKEIEFAKENKIFTYYLPILDSNGNWDIFKTRDILELK